MTLEELISSWFTANDSLAGSLAQYAKRPAVFLQSAPADNQPGWGKGQYPRIVYSIDMRADSERKSAGRIVVDLYCDASGVPPEELEPKIRGCLKDLILEPDDGSPYCFVWATTQPFELERNGSNDKRVIGSEVVFDVLEYPEQITTDPDPVTAINRFLKSAFPEILVLGLDELKDHYAVATEQHPIAYVRVVNHELDHCSFALSWLNCRMAIHVIAPSARARNKWVRCVNNLLVTEQECLMDDGSPIRITSSAANSAFDYLISGQISLNTQYTMIRLKTAKAAPVENIKVRR